MGEVHKGDLYPSLSDDRATCYAQTIHNLDAAYPHGWRCGEPTTDAMTVIIATGLREMLGALLTPKSGSSTGGSDG